MCEDAARTVLLARRSASSSGSTQADIDALHDRYQNVYGQRRGAGERESSDGASRSGEYELWFVAGSQDLYGEAVLAQVDADAREIAAALDARRRDPGARRPARRRDDAEAIRRLCLEANAAERLRRA